MIELEIAAMRWLTLDKRCQLVFFERAVGQENGGIPDVFGITQARHRMEIEVKRSLSDFRANQKKACVDYREMWIKKWPRYFWFAVPLLIADKCEQELPPYAGLLIVDGFRVTEKVAAPVNKESQKISVKDAIKTLRVLGNQILSTETSIYELRMKYET